MSIRRDFVFIVVLFLAGVVIAPALSAFEAGVVHTQKRKAAAWLKEAETLRGGSKETVLNDLGAPDKIEKGTQGSYKFFYIRHFGTIKRSHFVFGKKTSTFEVKATLHFYADKVTCIDTEGPSEVKKVDSDSEKDDVDNDETQDVGVPTTTQNKTQEEPIPARQQSEQSIKIGNQYYNNKDFVRARLAYEQAVQQDPGNENAWQGLGNAKYYLSDKNGALQAYNQVLTLDPKNSRVKMLAQKLSNSTNP
jgi:tetratricopeptide (TPR) repeat protein